MCQGLHLMYTTDGALACTQTHSCCKLPSGHFRQAGLPAVTAHEPMKVSFARLQKNYLGCRRD